MAPAAGQGKLKGDEPQGSRPCNCSLGFGKGFAITEPRSACHRLWLPGSFPLITCPLFGYVRGGEDAPAPRSLSIRAAFFLWDSAPATVPTLGPGFPVLSLLAQEPRLRAGMSRLRCLGALLSLCRGDRGQNPLEVLLLGELACMWLGQGVWYPTSPFPSGRC